MSNEQNATSNDGQANTPSSENDGLENENIDYASFSDDIDPIIEEPKANTPVPCEKDARIAALEEALATTKDHMLRAVAEAENGRKRALKEREDASKYAVSKFSRDLLSVADNLRRALDATPAELIEQQPQFKSLINGIEATERELLRSFDKNGIKKTEPMGERFDPNFHEVMFEAPMPDKPAGTIIQIIESGYTLNGRLLRPARVGISKNEGAPPTETPPSEPGHTIDTQA